MSDEITDSEIIGGLRVKVGQPQTSVQYWKSRAHEAEAGPQTGGADPPHVDDEAPDGSYPCGNCGEPTQSTLTVYGQDCCYDCKEQVEPDRVGRNKLRPFSKKRASEHRKRVGNLKKKYSDQTVPCQVRQSADCCGVAHDGHERKTRGKGGSITDLENVIPSCRQCHDWIGANILQATKLGFLV